MLSAVRFSVYLALTFTLIPVQMLAVARAWPLRDRLPLFYHKLVCRIFGFEVEVVGAPTRDRPTLFVSNHGSYIDIEVLGSVVPGSFIAKHDVAAWPLFGLLAKLQRTVFVDRLARTASKQQRDSVADRLAAGDNLILFPEGTSNDGNRLVPFKSSLFGAAEIKVDGKPITVQPLTIAYVRVDGMPMQRRDRPNFAWYGDMALVDHMWRLIGAEGVRFLVVFHEPVSLRDFASRKTLAAHCERVIARTLSAANAGRPPYPHAWGPEIAAGESAPERSIA